MHHTENPYKSFKIIINNLKYGGYIVLGLYNRIGRTRTIVRKWFAKIFGIKLIEYLDPTLRKLKLDKDQKHSWINDQYFHPIENLHTVDEVLNWFKKNNITFVSSIPSCDFELYQDYSQIFKKNQSEIYIQDYLIRFQ